MPRRPRPPNLASRACAALVCLTAACNFDAQGLGESTDVVLSASSSGSGAPPGTTTGPGSTSTGEPTPGSSGDASSTGEPVCVEDCPPVPAWTVMAPAEPHALALDAAGDAVVVGDCPQASNAAISDIWTGKFAGLDGAQIWEARHNGGQHGRDFARGVALTPDGRVVVVGGSREVSGRGVDLWVGWYAGDTGELLTSGNLMTGHWNGDDALVDEWAEAVAIDGAGGLVLAGSRCPASCEVPDAWIGRFDATGAALWGEPMLPVATGSFRGLLLDDDRLLPFGSDGYDASPLPWRTLLRRLDDDGAGTWSALPDPPGELGFIALAAALADDGGLWVVGRELAVGAEQGFLRLYRPDRADTPVAELHGAELGGSLGAVVLDADGDPIVAGARGRGTTRHLWLARFTRELAPVWQLEVASDEASDARGLARDAHGGLWVLGAHQPDADTRATSWLRRYTPGP